MSFNKQPTLYMMVGLPGSGKSTVIARMTDKIGYPHQVLSTDEFIEAKAREDGKSYAEVFEKYIGPATANIDNDLRDALAQDLDIYWDQTNLSKKARAKKLAKIPRHYQKVAVLVTVSDEKLQEQLNGRVAKGGKFISPKVVEEMRRTYEEPSLDEGFDLIINANTRKGTTWADETK